MFFPLQLRVKIAMIRAGIKFDAKVAEQIATERSLEGSARDPCAAANGSGILRNQCPPSHAIGCSVFSGAL
jgi:hypothetical protein